MLDTHLLLWTAGASKKMSRKASRLIENRDNRLYFSPASIWEVVIKNWLGRKDFKVDANLLCKRLLENDYAELPITSAHALAVNDLPDIHQDPFDRIMIAQADCEGMLLLTSDKLLKDYSAAVRVI